MINWSAEAWRSLVEGAPEGIVICDATAPDYPVIYANAAFAQMCGYPTAALLGTNLRVLQGNDRDQETRQRMREAIEKGEQSRALIRNYRPDGSLFWNEIVIQPVRDASGKLTHFIGYHRDASERLKQTGKALRTRGCRRGCARIASPDCIHAPTSKNCCNADWVLAQRDSHEIGLTLFEYRRSDNLQRNLRQGRRRCLHPPYRPRHRRILSPRRRPGRTLGRRHVRRPDTRGCCRKSFSIRAGGGATGA